MINMLFFMCGVQLKPDPGLFLGYHGVAKAYHVNAFIQ